MKKFNSRVFLNLCCYDIIVSCDFQDPLVDFENWHLPSFSHWLVFEWEVHLPAGDTILLIGTFLVERCLLMCLNEKSLGPFASPFKGNVSQRKLKTKLTCVLNIVSTIYASTGYDEIFISYIGKFSDTFVCVPRKVKRITLLEELLSLFKRIE